MTYRAVFIFVIIAAVLVVVRAQTYSCKKIVNPSCTILHETATPGICTYTESSCSESYVPDSSGNCACIDETITGLIKGPTIDGTQTECSLGPKTNPAVQTCEAQCSLGQSTLGNIPFENDQSSYLLTSTRSLGAVFTVNCDFLNVEYIQVSVRAFTTEDISNGATFVLYELFDNNTVDINNPRAIFNVQNPPASAIGDRRLMNLTSTIFPSIVLERNRYVFGMGCNGASSLCQFDWSAVSTRFDPNAGIPDSNNGQFSFEGFAELRNLEVRNFSIRAIFQIYAQGVNT